MLKYALAETDHDRQTCQKIMDEIYSEEPEYWPHGLSVGHHDAGCWMVREASTGKPAGWVGFQVRPEWDGQKNAFVNTGFYTIGLLPEYRGAGMASEAVRMILEKKAREVDRVKAMVVSRNSPSLALARRLGVTVNKV